MQYYGVVFTEYLHALARTVKKNTNQQCHGTLTYRIRQDNGLAALPGTCSLLGLRSILI